MRNCGQTNFYIFFCFEFKDEEDEKKTKAEKRKQEEEEMERTASIRRSKIRRSSRKGKVGLTQFFFKFKLIQRAKY